MAFDLFGATRSSQHCSIVLSFQNSLQLSGFPPEVCEKWTIWCDSGLLDDLVIKPQVLFDYYQFDFRRKMIKDILFSKFITQCEM